jgi:GNAT superfamily N-acetyltransferase
MSSACIPTSSCQEYRRGNFLISTDPAKLDIAAIHAFLTRGYFDTEGIDQETVARSVQGSLCFGVYDGQQQVGFARVITDFATFAYFCDDYILESHRGQGLAKWLMDCVLKHPGLRHPRRWILGPTRDTRLYEKFGFKPVESQWMELKPS